MALELPDSLEPHEETFTYLGKEYVVREASADAVAQYKDANLNASRYEDGPDGERKLVGYKDMNQSEILMVSLCVGRLRRDTTGAAGPGYERLTLEEVKAWPSRLTSPLFNWVKEHSDFGEDTVESLERQVAFFQKRLDRLKASKEKSVSKNGRAATAATSDSRPS